MSNTARLRLITTGIGALLVLAGVVSASHIVDTAGMLGLSGWYRFAAVGLIDFVAVVGKLSMHAGFARAFRRSGFRLLMTGGTLSLAANIYAGNTLGEKAFGALTVGVFMMLEHHVTKAGASEDTTQQAHNEPQPPAAAPVSPGQPPAELEPPEVLAFREAQAELRRTSRLAGLQR